MGYVKSKGSKQGVNTGGKGNRDLALLEGKIKAGDVKMLEASSTTDLESDFESKDSAEEEQDKIDSQDTKYIELTCSCLENITWG